MDPKFVKITLPYTLTYFTHLINTIVTTCTFPSMWKHAKSVPILKPDKSFRPIAILSYLSKVFEKLIHAQISRHLHTNSLLNERQTGFRPKHSCISALEMLKKSDYKLINVGLCLFLYCLTILQYIIPLYSIN